MLKKFFRKSVQLSLLVTAFLSLSPVLHSCSGGLSPEEAAQAEAMAVAQACYDRLQEGDYEGFLAFRHDIDAIPKELRSQLVDAYKRYMATEEQMHRGVKKFTAARAQMDSTLQVMQVFMVLDYGDGSQEEVVVPMVTDASGQWRMK